MSDYADPALPNGASKTDTQRATARAAVEPKLKAAASAAKDAVGSVKDVAVESLGETRDRVQALASQAGDQAQQRYRTLESWTRENPGRALGVAAAVGLVLGLLMRGSSVKTIYLRDAR
jgi:ElaB/YqjD/DUF883 family membrane-anchored ribosome-binding protein